MNAPDEHFQETSLISSIIPKSYLALLDPVSDESPCGIDLEYHPDLLVAQTRAARHEPAQYGAFVAPQEAVNWRDLETLVMGLLNQGRDLRALVLLLRCRTHLAGAEGAYQAFWLLAELLDRYPDDIHPQRSIDGEADPALQSNALGLLAEHALLADLCEVVIDRASATYLTLRDLERAQAMPRLPNVRDTESIDLQLQALHERGHPEITALVGCQVQIARITAWAKEVLAGDAPDLKALTTLFGAFARLGTPVDHAAGDSSNPSLGQTCEPLASPGMAQGLPEQEPLDGDALPVADQQPLPSNREAEGLPVEWNDTAPSAHGPAAIAGREQALAQIRAARQWFESAEPSSPVADLLRQAERLTGKCYAEIAEAIPLDLLARWREAD